MLYFLGFTPNLSAESSASLYLSKVQELSSVVHFSSFNQSLPTTPKVAAKGSGVNSTGQTELKKRTETASS